MKFNIASLKRYISPQAYKDMDIFVREMPERAGQTVLIAGGIAWMLAATGIVFATVKTKETADIRANLFKQEAITPAVPNIVDSPVSNDALDSFAKKATDQYQNVQISAANSKLQVTSSDTRYYWAWREAVGHIYNGGNGWRLKIDELCVGRECKAAKLDAKFSVNTLQVQPATNTIVKTESSTKEEKKE